MKTTLLTVFSLAVWLVGCTGTTDSGEYLHYHCDSGKGFDVAYFASQDRATLRLDGQSYPLIQMPSGSGTRYILDDKTTALNAVTLYTKGNEARLEFEQSIYKNCKTD